MPPCLRLVTILLSLTLPAAAQLTTVGNQIFQQGAGGIIGNFEAGDRFASSLIAGDFNGDGYDDLAIGVPEESGAEGLVNVIYSGSTGLTSVGNQVWEQRSGLGSNSENNDFFGLTVASADFNQDGYDDLAVGAPGEDDARGIVHVIYGTADGLALPGNQLWKQGQDGIRGDDERSDLFGGALDTGDFNGDGFPDLAVGSPGENNFGGAIWILFGSNTGITANGNQRWRQGDENIRGSDERNDLFGNVLAAGDFNGDGVSDLLIGTPGENNGRGTVNMLLGFSGGLMSTGNRRFEQDSDGIPDDREGGDNFGSVIEAGDFNGDGYDDVAVASLGENDEQSNVIIIPGSPNALNPGASFRIRQGEGGLPDDREDGDRFGSALESGDFNLDGYYDLAIGVRGEDGNRGLLHIMYGTANGLRADNNQVFAQGASGLADQAETSDDFSFALAAGDFAGDRAYDLAIGAPGEDNDRGVAHVIYGDAPFAPAISAVVGAGLSVPAVTTGSYNSILTIFGTEFIPVNEGPTRAAQGVPTNSNGVCIEMDGNQVPIFGAFPGQINFQANVQPGQTTSNVVVIANCDQPGQVASATFTLDLAPSSPEFFFFEGNADGVNPIAAVNESTGALVGSGPGFEAAVEGEVVTVFMTGLGETDPLIAPGQLAPGAASATQQVTIQVGGIDTPAIYAGVSPGFAGLYQVSFEIPAGLGAGNAAVTITVGNATTPPGGFLALGSPL